MEHTDLLNQLSLWLDGALGPAETQALEKRLSENPDDRQVFLKFMTVHAELSNLSTGRQQVESIFHDSSRQFLAENPLADSDASGTGASQPVWGIAALCASLLIGLTIGISWWMNQYSDQPIASNSTPEYGQTIPLSVEATDEKCVWYVESENRSKPASFRIGDVLRVTDGKLAITYPHGTKIVLHSPAAYQLLSDMKARMIIGRLTANVSETAKGFSVVTPQATVIDLGTEFGVEVNNDGATDFLVFKGEVDIDFHNDETSRVPAQRLRMGEAVRLDAIGTKSRIASINGRNYSDFSSDIQERPPVITNVRDNIERKSLLSYYEIVPSGLGEDALAYVDRIAHEYNGVTEAGMPDYLVGADYVKMFNSDKLNPEIAIEVTLSGPSKLFVLLDNRLVPPKWLTDGFQDTGDDIGVDAGPYRSKGPSWHNKGPSGVGPGASVDNQLSIWVKELPEAGVVPLGPAAVSVGSGGFNMYGIVAIPLTP